MGGKHTLGLLCHQAYRTLIRVCGHKRVCIIHACAIVQCSKQKSLFQNIFYLQGRLQVQTCSANNPIFLMCRLPQSSKLLNMCLYLYKSFIDVVTTVSTATLINSVVGRIFCVNVLFESACCGTLASQVIHLYFCAAYVG